MIDQRRDEEFREAMQELIQGGLPDDVLKRARKQIVDLMSDIEDQTEAWVKDEMAGRLAWYVEEMANRAIEAMLAGNEAMLRRYLSCEERGYTGRDRTHSVIHGRLFETGGIEARKLIVDAYAELLKTERILDLESQVDSLVAQVCKLEASAEDLRQKLNWASAS